MNLDQFAQSLGRTPQRARLPVARRTDPADDTAGAMMFGVFTYDDGPVAPGNLAVLIALDPDSTDPQLWQRRRLDLDANAVVIPESGGWLLVSSDDGFARETRSAAATATWLAERRAELFTPRGLLSNAPGQATFASLESTIERRSFTFVLRQQDRLVASLVATVREVFDKEAADRSATGREPVEGTQRDVVRVALALVAARTLEDKGHLGPEPTETADPKRVLGRAVERVNGFLKKTHDVILNRLGMDALTALASGVSLRLSFALLDHRHLGELYEKLVNLLPEEDDATAAVGLQRHYTPLALTEKILDHLPLELLRPEDRVVFDPAAGSGSFLLAATRRLSQMKDLPADRAAYLREHVIGNDRDGDAKLVFKLRYYLGWGVGPQDSVEPATYTQRRFEEITAENIAFMGKRPTVYVANPPYRDEPEQAAAAFVRHALTWMHVGDMFAFVLPQPIIDGTSAGYKRAREDLFARCEIFEIWELPEKAVGLEAEQPTAVILGRYGDPPADGCRLRRRLGSRQRVAERVHHAGFVGGAWIDAPSFTGVRITIPTVRLGALFYPFIGVTLDPQHPPVTAKVPGVVCHPYPKARPSGEEPNPEPRWIRYLDEGADETDIAAQRKYLKRPEWRNRKMFTAPKLLLVNSSNRDSSDPLRARFDGSGLFPNHHIYCVGDLATAAALGLASQSPTAPLGWSALESSERLIWLLGILRTRLARTILGHGRTVRSANIESIREFPLPLRVDQELLTCARELHNLDEAGEGASQSLLNELEGLVRLSYGNPFVLDHLDQESFQARSDERARPTVAVSGQVLSFDASVGRGSIRVRLVGLVDEVDEFDLPLPQEIPGWMLRRPNVFTGRMSDDIRTVAQLRERPWALRDFACDGRPYLTAEDLQFDEDAAP